MRVGSSARSVDCVHGKGTGEGAGVLDSRDAWLS